MGWQSFARQDGQPIALAGLWEGFRWPNGTVTRSFAIITTKCQRGGGGTSRQDAGDPRTTGLAGVVGRSGWRSASCRDRLVMMC